MPSDDQLPVHLVHASSLQRKRERDRRAQKNKRERREAYIRELEQKVAYCQQHHPQLGIPTPEEEGREHPLESSNHTPLQSVPISIFNGLRPLGQESGNSQYHLQVSKSTAGDAYTSQNSARSCPEDFSFASSARELQKEQYVSDQRHLGLHGTLSLAAYSSASHRPMNGTLIERPITQNTPAWLMIPLSTIDDALAQVWAPWLSAPAVMSTLPDFPLPQDLLHGSKRNPIANSIHLALRRLEFGQLEKLAAGWVVYVYSKWRLAPSEKSFNNVPVYLRPTRLQLTQHHLPMIDYIFFPEMRDNFVIHGLADKIEAIWEANVDCFKLEWPTGQSYMELDDNDVLQFTHPFVETVHRTDKWKLESAFWDKYPHLVAGMNPFNRGL